MGHKACLTPITDLLTGFIDRAETSSFAQSVTGLPTGFADLDEITAGLHPGQLIVLAGRPSMGKTALAMNIAEYVACVKGDPVAVFNMEMSKDNITMRALSSRAWTDARRLCAGRTHDDDWPRWCNAIKELMNAPLFIAVSSENTVEKIRADVVQLKQKQDVRLIVVDCLQRMLHGDKPEEITKIVRGLKTLAMELQLPVILTSQLNKEIDFRVDKRPKISDLLHMGALGDDADLILFLYRHEIYYRDEVLYQDRDNLLGMAEVIIGKHRNGPLGSVRIRFFGEFVRFENGSRIIRPNR